jgi:ABC-type multidrug transport system ATPase subunit
MYDPDGAVTPANQNKKINAEMGKRTKDKIQINAVRDVSLRLEKGEVLGLLGGNG